MSSKMFYSLRFSNLKNGSAVLHMHNSRNFNEQRLIRTVQVLVIQVSKPEKHT